MDKKFYTLNIAVILAALYFFGSIITANLYLFQRVVSSFLDDTCNCNAGTFFSYSTEALIGLVVFIIASSYFLKRFETAEPAKDDTYVPFIWTLGKVAFWTYAAYILYYPTTYLLAGGSFAVFAANFTWQLLVLAVTGYFFYARGILRSHTAFVVLWATMALMVIVSMMAGFMVFGTPSQLNKAAADLETLSRMENMSRDVDYYVEDWNDFPTIADLREERGGEFYGDIYENPVTREEFALEVDKNLRNGLYVTLQGTYKICSTIFSDYKRSFDITQDSIFTDYKPNKGVYCMDKEYKIYPERYPDEELDFGSPTGTQGVETSEER